MPERIVYVATDADGGLTTIFHRRPVQSGPATPTAGGWFRAKGDPVEEWVLGPSEWTRLFPDVPPPPPGKCRKATLRLEYER